MVADTGIATDDPPRARSGRRRGRRTAPATVRPGHGATRGDAGRGERVRAPRPERGLTTRGRCLIAGGGAAIVCALLLDERDLLRVGIVAVVLPLVAMLANAGRRLRISASHQIQPDRLRPGGTGRVRLLLSNRGGRRSQRVEVSDPPVRDLTAGVRSMLPPLAPGATGVVSYPLTAARRGRFAFHAPQVRLADPFGLWEERRLLPSRAEVLVVPSTVTLTGMPGAAGSRSAASGSAVTGLGAGDPDVQIRQYVAGDDIRTIHWHASARRDDLMVRLREPVSHGGVTVVLDHRADAHRGIGATSSLETAVTMVASVSLHLLGGDYQLGLRNHLGETLASGNDIADDVLAVLAEVEGDPDGAFQPEAVRHPGLVVAVLGELDAGTAHALAAGRSRAARAVAFLLDTQTWDPTGSPAESATGSAAILQAGGWTTVVIRRGEDLATAWRQARGAA